MAGVMSDSWLRRLPTGAAFGIGVALIVLVQAVLAVVGAAGWLQLTFAVVLFLAAIGVELVKLRDKRREAAAAAAEHEAAASAEWADWERSVTALVRRWPPRRADEEDPFLVGVQHPIGPGPQDLGPYVHRDADHRAASKLQGDGALLIIGEPASGVTRTALHALTEKWPGALLLAPDPDRPDAPRQLLEELNVLAELECPPTTVVLWLDRIERWLSGGLSAGWLHELHGTARLRVVASINTGAYRSLEPLHPELFAEFGSPILLRRLPSARELSQAQQTYPGIDFSEGIAAAFTAAGSLLRRWHAGFGDCPDDLPDADCPVARAVVETCVDWQRTGTPRPVPLTQLSALAEQRLTRPEPITDEHLDVVLTWAAAKTREAASLLLREPDAGRVVRADTRFAELLAEDADAVPTVVWTAAHEEARQAGDAEAAGRVGFQTHVVRSWDIAETVWAEVPSLNSPDADWLKLAAEFSDNRGDPRGKVLARSRLLELTEHQHGSDAVATANAITHLGIAWSDLGEPSRARHHHERALRIYRNRLNPTDPHVADSLVNLGNAWSDLGEPARARDQYEQALRIRQDWLGPDNLKIVADILTNIGTAWLNLGAPDHARDHHEQALQIYSDQFGPDDPEVADSLVNLGSAWRVLGHPDKAQTHYEHALHIYQGRLGPDHPNVAHSLTGLGNACHDLGKLDEARDHHERALRIYQNRLEPDHPHVAGSLTNLGIVWRDLGHPKLARDCFEQALRIYQSRLGPDHPDTAASLDNLGIAWSSLGDLDKARNHHEQALRIYENRLRPDHPSVATSLTNLGTTLTKLGQLDEARKCLREALAIFRLHYLPTHPHVRHVERALRNVDPDTVRVHGHEAILPTADPTD
jgi:tetratricopeptide (TPR) repeat protein